MSAHIGAGPRPPTDRLSSHLHAGYIPRAHQTPQITIASSYAGISGITKPHGVQRMMLCTRAYTMLTTTSSQTQGPFTHKHTPEVAPSKPLAADFIAARHLLLVALVPVAYPADIGKRLCARKMRTQRFGRVGGEELPPADLDQQREECVVHDARDTKKHVRDDHQRGCDPPRVLGDACAGYSCNAADY